MKKQLRIESNGAGLYVEEAGSGPAVVLGHSLLCDGRMFEHQLAHLSETNQVINVDARNHGRSDKSRQSYTLYDQADDLLRIMDHLGIDKAVHIGLSMGGMAAMRFALRHPDRVAGLALLDTSGDPELPFNRVRYGLMSLALRTIGPHPTLINDVCRIMFGSTFRKEHPQIVKLWYQRFTELDPPTISRAVEAVTQRDNVYQELRRISVPCLIIVGDEDIATPTPFAYRLTQILQNSRLEIVKQAGHLSTVEQPDELNRLLSGFLTEIDWR